MSSKLLRADSDAKDWELCLVSVIFILFILLCRQGI